MHDIRDEDEWFVFISIFLNYTVVIPYWSVVTPLLAQN
jgi:hypothetical protein